MSFNESLSKNSNYPPMSQSEWDRAPWNQVDPKPIKLDVVVSVTLSKTFTIDVDDYTVEYEGADEDGNYTQEIDYSDCNLTEAVENQCYLPQEASEFLKEAAETGHITNKAAKIRDLSNWDVDEFIVERI